MQDKTDTFTQSESIAVDESPIEKVLSTYRYHGAIRYDIVAGVEPNGEEGFAFVPVNQQDQEVDFDTKYISAQNVVSEEQILSHWRERCGDCELNKISPAMEEQKPLWEITYIDPQNRYGLEYYYMKDAKKYEEFRFKQ